MLVSIRLCIHGTLKTLLINCRKNKMGVEFKIHKYINIKHGHYPCLTNTFIFRFTRRKKVIRVYDELEDLFFF